MLLAELPLSVKSEFQTQLTPVLSKYWASLWLTKLPKISTLSPRLGPGFSRPSEERFVYFHLAGSQWPALGLEWRVSHNQTLRYSTVLCCTVLYCNEAIPNISSPDIAQPNSFSPLNLTKSMLASQKVRVTEFERILQRSAGTGGGCGVLPWYWVLIISCLVSLPAWPRLSLCSLLGWDGRMSPARARQPKICPILPASSQEWGGWLSSNTRPCSDPTSPSLTARTNQRPPGLQPTNHRPPPHLRESCEAGRSHKILGSFLPRNKVGWESYLEVGLAVVVMK